LIFPSATGTYERDSNWTSRAWKDTRATAKLPHIHFHDLRHFYVSTIRGENLPAAWTQQLVGHSDDRTHDAYTHVVPGSEQAIRAAMSAAFTIGATND
jgi:integrase